MRSSSKGRIEQPRLRSLCSFHLQGREKERDKQQITRGKKATAVTKTNKMRSNSMISLFLRQDCIGGSCRAFCKAKERCVQNCVDGRCPMRCVSHQCQQSCQVGACSLKCRTGKECDQQCSSDCPLVSCHSKEGSCKQVSICIKCCFQL